MRNMHRTGRATGRWFVAATLSLGLIAAACSKKDDNSSDTNAPATSAAATTAGGAATTAGGAATTAGGATTTAASGTTASSAPAEKAVPGGSMIVAGDAEVANPWTPAA